MAHQFKYIIVGGGLAAASAVEGLRSRDISGPIALFGKENRMPYDRPPLSKGLWSRKTTFNQLPIHPDSFYSSNNVHMFLGTEITEIDPKRNQVIDDDGHRYTYDKLLIATGGSPRRLSFGDGVVRYFRTADDYLEMLEATKLLRSFVLIGGGFIGAELAAALVSVGKEVTMIFPDRFILQKVLPADLARHVTDYYRSKGVTILEGDVPTDAIRSGGVVHLTTREGKKLTTDVAIAAIGLNLHLEFAKRAGLKVENGITVNPFLQTSIPNIYAAGDVAFFPSKSLDKSIRIEHWDNAQSQGKHVGENMVGANKPFDYLPYFYSDLFDLGFEAIGELDSRLTAYADWHEEFREGVVYYLDDDLVKGILLWNVWGKVDDARDLINRKKQWRRAADLKGKL
jgi:3-phenylpropionate/trans-cinnamate dioxygenase ferredoxin reductase component